MATPPEALEPSHSEDPFPISDEDPITGKIVLEGLPAKSFRHTLDLAKSLALHKTKGFETVAKALSSGFYEQLQTLKNVTEYVQVGPSQYGELHERYLKLASVLTISRVPDLFIMNSPVVKAEAFGTQRYTIRVSSALIDAMNDDELDAVLAHELGHVKCDHMRYKTMASLLNDFGGFAATFIPIPGVSETLFLNVQLALLEWNRKAEYSCDRAALLAVQDLAPVRSAITKLAGCSRSAGEPLDLDALLEQVDGYEDLEAESPFEKALKVSILRDQNHLCPVIRLREITQWADSSQYEAILNKQYETFTEEMWYVAVDRDAVGPMTMQELREALRSGRYTGKDYVFASGMSDWAQASTVETLAAVCPANGRAHLPKIPEV